MSLDEEKYRIELKKDKNDIDPEYFWDISSYVPNIFFKILSSLKSLTSSGICNCMATRMNIS